MHITDFPETDLEQTVPPGFYTLLHHWTTESPNEYAIQVIDPISLGDIVERLEIDFEPDKGEVIVLETAGLAVLQTDKTTVHYYGEPIHPIEDGLGKGWAWSGGSAPSLEDVFNEIDNSDG